MTTRVNAMSRVELPVLSFLGLGLGLGLRIETCGGGREKKESPGSSQPDDDVVLRRGNHQGRGCG